MCVGETSIYVGYIVKEKNVRSPKGMKSKYRRLSDCEINDV